MRRWEAEEVLDRSSARRDPDAKTTGQSRGEPEGRTKQDDPRRPALGFVLLPIQYLS